MTVSDTTSTTTPHRPEGPGVTQPGAGPLPSRREVSDIARLAGAYLPDRKRLLYYGALGVLAAAEIVEWPVALAIGVGTEVARRTVGTSSASRPGPVTAVGPGAGTAVGAGAGPGAVREGDEAAESMASTGSASTADDEPGAGEAAEKPDATDKPAGRRRTSTQ